MTGKWRWAQHRRGQGTVEFAIIILAFLTLVIAVIDLARAAFLQNRLDSGVADLARNLAAISGTTTSGSQFIWTPPPLDPSSSTLTLYQGNKISVKDAIQAALVHACGMAGMAGDTFCTAALTPSGGTFSPATTTTISNSRVVVVGLPNLGTPMQGIQVTVSTPFTPVVGRFLPIKTITLQSRQSVIPVEGLAPSN